MDYMGTAVLLVVLAFLSGASSVLILGTGAYIPIYFYDTETHENKIFMNNSHDFFTALDYHFSKGYIYYSGYKLVRRSIYTNSNDLKVIEKGPRVESVAVDWINNNIYWSRSYEVEIKKADLDGNNKVTIITKKIFDQVKGLSNILNVHCIQVDPYERSLFMIAAQALVRRCGILVKSDLEGRNLSVITNNKYTDVIFVTINPLKKILYVVKAYYGPIYSCNYDGEVIEEFSGCQNFGMVYTFATFHQNMYLATVNGPQGSRHFVVKPFASIECLTDDKKMPYVDDIYDVKVYHADVQLSLNGYNSYQRLKHRFSNLDKCSLLSTEWEKIECLEMAPLETANKSASGVKLLIGRSNGIIQRHDTKTQETVVIVNDSMVLSLDYHYSKGYVYYAGDSIKRRSFDPSINDLKEISDDRYVYGIAVDWINDHLYWTRSIDVEVVKADLDGNEGTSIITQRFLNQQKGLSNINYLYNIEVDPYERALFMIAGTESEIFIGTIVKTDLEGKDLSVITHSKYKFIAAFTVDRQPKILYVVSKGHQGIYSCRYNGEIIQEISVCPKMWWIYPFAMFRQNMYMAYGYEEHGNNNVFYSGQLTSVKCPIDSLKTDNIILGIKVYSIDVQQPLNVSNRNQPLKQRFSNWNKCSLLPTEWERLDCLDRALLETSANKRSRYISHDDKSQN